MARRCGAGAKDVSAKAFSYAEKNVQASLDYAQALLHAKDLAEVMRLHREYVQAQMRALAEQASEMGQIVGRAAIEAARPKDVTSVTTGQTDWPLTRYSSRSCAP